jgi:hypothetical protein
MFAPIIFEEEQRPKIPYVFRANEMFVQWFGIQMGVAPSLRI